MLTIDASFSGEGELLISLEVLVAASLLAHILCHSLIPNFRDGFIKAGLFGIDLNKRRRGNDGDKVPEATGVLVGCVFLMAAFLLIPFTVWPYYFAETNYDRQRSFPHAEFVHLISALLSISCMLLLGFADDVLDLRWRHKLLLPALASLPLLMVYYVTLDRTDVVLPLMLRPFFGTNVDLGALYYVYMGMLAVFCTNAVNIYAGINGLEVGQSIIIALSIAIFNLKEMNGLLGHHHRFSLFFLLPYLGTSLALLRHNWYPAKVFPGDTFCYFSGMTLAVVAILGHFSKTLMLFFVPQIVNFLYSLPQLFHLVPCPRHRLPKYDQEADVVGVSTATFKESDLHPLGRLSLVIFSTFGLVQWKKFEKDGEPYMECNNLTLINFVLLRVMGPTPEENLTVVLLVLQAAFSVIAFVIRYPMALYLYGEIIA